MHCHAGLGRLHAKMCETRVFCISLAVVMVHAPFWYCLTGRVPPKCCLYCLVTRLLSLSPYARSLTTTLDDVTVLNASRWLDGDQSYPNSQSTNGWKPGVKKLLIRFRFLLSAAIRNQGYSGLLFPTCASLWKQDGSYRNLAYDVFFRYR